MPFFLFKEPQLKRPNVHLYNLEFVPEKTVPSISTTVQDHLWSRSENEGLHFLQLSCSFYSLKSNQDHIKVDKQ